MIADNHITIFTICLFTLQVMTFAKKANFYFNISPVALADIVNSSLYRIFTRMYSSKSDKYILKTVIHGDKIIRTIKYHIAHLCSVNNS